MRARLRSMSLSSKLTIAYTVMVMLVAGMLTVTLYLQLREAQRRVARERLRDMVSLAVTQIDGDFHTLIVAPEDATSSFYRIIQSELRTIQTTSTAITRITTLREQEDGRVVVVVDQALAPAAAAPIGQAFEAPSPVLAAGLATITTATVDADVVMLASGAERFFGYAPIVDQSGRQDGVLAIELDASPLIASETQARNTALGAFLLTLPLVLLAGIVLVGRATAAVGQLLQGAERITQGQLDHRVPVQGSDELGMLAAAFNTMTDALQERIETEHHARQELSQTHQQLLDYNHALEQAMQEQQRLGETVRQMSLPVIPIAHQIILLPLIGTIDSQRAHELSEALLHGIEHHRAHVVLLDLTGVALVDAMVAQVLAQAIVATRLLGARPLLVGIRPELAQAFVQIGANLYDVPTSATLQSGLLHALGLTGRRLVAK